MNDKGSAIAVDNLSKHYRIGLKEEIHDSLGVALLDFIKRPLKNYRKYRSLYRFDDLNPENNGKDDPADVLWALREISFSVAQGEVLGIIGRNGAGKSTLLKILARITEPSTGRAEIRGKVSSLLEVGTGFHPELTGRDNVYLNGTILGMKKREVDRKFDEIVDFSGVEKFIDTPVKRYSSGMKVRLAFSVAAFLEPDILIIDEVLAVGDADFQRKCLDTMKEVGSSGRTVLFVSHNMPAVTRLCERTILLEDGRITADGPSGEVVTRHLRSGNDSMAIREWPDPEKAPGGPVARLRAVRVRAKDGRISQSLDIRQPFQIEMEYDVVKGGRVLLPHFGIVNEHGEAVFVTVDQDAQWRQRPRPEGSYVSSVWIPGNLLAEGMLFVNCHLLTLFPETLQFSEFNAVTFQVVDSLEGDSARGDYAKNMPGVVRPLLEWNTEYVPWEDSLGYREGMRK
ncbi:ABC transporter ATP-binding protein [Desulfuromonas sp. TF]|uniref:ABC transporter ATP-binding protein n=1 Tax=Desulfuromonas sp. TF TaxID=1232410 RepID=UPI000418C8CD|nr:ABC transporter ATP-binding protein [Desulfuromonas sp. TF]